MSDMRHLLEKMNKFAGEKVGQKPGDQVRGSEPMPKKGGGKKHPYAGRLVGANESSGNLLKELTTVINGDPVKRDLFQEWAEFKEGFDDTVKSAADKIISAGGATRDALGAAIDSIPRPFDEKEVAKSIKQGQREQIRKDVKDVSGDYGKEQQRQTTPSSPEQRAGIKQAVKDYNQEKQDKKQTVDEETVRVFGKTPIGVPRSKWNYDDPEVRFFHRYEDGSEEELRKGTPDYNDAWRSATGREDPMTQKLIDLMQEPRQPSKEFEVPDPLSPQDYKVPGQDQGPYIPPDEQRSYMSDTPISEWGAAGTAVGPGNDDADPVEIAAQRAQQVAGKTEQHNQLMGLVGQVNGARSQLADLNKQFPQGANPVEKAMSLQQQQAQRVQLSRQIEDLMSQVAALRSQA